MFLTFDKDPISFFLWVFIPVGVGRRWQQDRCYSSEPVVFWVSAFHSLGVNMLTLPKIESSFFKSNSFKEKIVKTVSRSVSFKKGESKSLSPTPRNSDNIVLEQSPSFKNWEPEKKVVEDNASFKIKDVDSNHQSHDSTLFSTEVGASPKPPKDLIELISPRPRCELDAAAVKLQKVYKSYRTRRNLADCAVVIEELWWKALDSASLKLSSVLFFEGKKQETAVSRWTRARKRVAKVGKGLSKDEKAQKLALQHWLEAIDPRHRYGHNLHLYYDVWFASESTQPFFYWLDIGDGKEVNFVKCPRTRLHQQCIKYLGPKEREAYEVIVDEGKLVYKQSQLIVNTVEGSKWIFVLSTTRNLYVGQKKRGTFQHSSFLAGAATSAAGRLVAKDGILEAIWPYSGHYLPTEDNFKVFISFLSENNVDLTTVKRCSVDDDVFPSFRKSSVESIVDLEDTKENTIVIQEQTRPEQDHNVIEEDNVKPPIFQISKHPSCKWTSGTGPRIGCVRDYPADLQFKALEQVNLSPRVTFSPITNSIPIPSPRPSPKIRLSPRLATMGIPSPRVSLTLPTFKH